MNSLRSRCVTTPATYLAIPDEADYNAPDDEVHIRDIKQRTPTWFKARDDGSFSSSQFSPGFGYHTVKRAEAVQQEAWAKVSLKSFKEFNFAKITKANSLLKTIVLEFC